MQNRCILIAEDDADDRFLLQTTFAEKGFAEKLEFVNNGIDLLTYLESVQQVKLPDRRYPAFIMLDLNMPKMDGREVLKTIKEHPEFKKIPIIIFTTTKNDDEIRLCYELGANSYVVKPVGFEELLNVLEAIRDYWFNIASIVG
jgi:two-component system response regulator